MSKNELKGLLGSSNCVVEVYKDNGFYEFVLVLGDGFKVNVKPSFKLSKKQFRTLMYLITKEDKQ